MDDKKLVPYLSPAAAFALSTGTAIGWGSFVVTGNLYLAQAGPLGSVLGMLVGMVIMLLIARNYHYMMNRYPGPGGAYTYMANTFGYDNAFLNAWLLLLALLSLIVTSLIGNLVAISRLIYELAKEEVLFDRFAVLNTRCMPENALHLIVMLSLLIIPFLGRIAIGWIVDVNTVVAVIVYGFISAAAYRCAGKNGDRVERVTGMAGMALMVGFGIVELFPAVFNTGSMATESYFLFMLWAILGIIFFRNVLVRDAARKFGKSIVV